MRVDSVLVNVSSWVPVEKETISCLGLSSGEVPCEDKSTEIAQRF
jgi:hypothetical protein